MSTHVKLGLLVLLIVAVLVAVPAVLSSRQQPLNFRSVNDYSFDFSNLKIESESKALKKIVQNNITPPVGSDSEIAGTYGVYIEDLTEDEKYGYNEQTVFPAASLYKLILLAAVFQQIEDNQISLTDSMTASLSYLNEILGGAEFGYDQTEGEISYTVDEALTRVTTFSDNYAAIMLTEKIRQQMAGDPLQQEAEKLAMLQTDFSGEMITITPLNIAHFFELLYRGEVVSQKSSQAIIDLLVLSQINNRIPAKLPEGLKIAHKTGELARIRHDAGIVYLDNHPYLIVLMSKDLKFEDDAVDLEAQISQDVYQYFAGKNSQ